MGRAVVARVAVLTLRSRILRSLGLGGAAALGVVALGMGLAGTPARAVAAVAAAAALLAGTTEWVMMRRQARRSQLTDRVARLATSGQPLDRVLAGIVTEMAREGLRGASIALVNESNEVYLAAAEGDLSDDVRALRLPVGQGIMGRVALTGEPAVVDDLDRPVGDLAAANRTVGSNARIRSIVAVPIRLDGDAFGVLEVDSRIPGRFSSEDVTLLTGIALAISGVVQRARPLRLANEQLRRRVHELTHLERVARALNASLDVDTVVREVLRSAAEGLNAPVAVLVRREGQALRVHATFRAGEPAVVDGARVRAAGGLDAAIDAARPTELPASALTALPEVAPLVSTQRLTVGLAAGLRWPGPQPDALLIVASPANRRFDAHECGLLDGIVHLAALAIGNAERYRRLESMASTDALTGLANMQEFERTLGAPHPAGISVIAVDVDRLKEVNDVAGHHAGDETLRRVASTLRAAVAGAGLVCRTGGDDFSVLVEGSDGQAAGELAERIRLAMHGLPVPHGVARVSVGVAVERDVVDPRRTWWSAADAAATAKMFGGDGVVRAGHIAPLSARQRRWESVLGGILEGDGVISVYQPIVRLRGGAVIGYEALARPKDEPECGVEGLFTAAQRSGRMRDVDWMCRRSALEGVRTMRDHTQLFINVGGWALLDPLHPVDQMLLLLEYAGRSPDGVVLELTERDLISDLPRLVDVLAEYRHHGFRFAVDDLGAGHSTLELLSHAMPEYIKLASTLVAARGNPGAEAAMAAVVTFARQLGATIIAEGIETAEQVDFMREVGVELGQGWWLGRPGALPADSARAPGAVEPAALSAAGRAHCSG